MVYPLFIHRWLVGIALVMMASAVIPKLMDRLTPNIDEEKESLVEIMP